jgi:hypothetical protein
MAHTRAWSPDIAGGAVKPQYAYPLTATKPGKYITTSELLALNNHQFLVDERDGKGFEGGGAAGYKVANLVDVNAPGVADVSRNTSFLKNSPAAVALRFVLDDDLQTDVRHNPTKILVFDFDQSDLASLGTANTAQSRGWQYVPQQLVSEQMPDYGSPEQFPSFLFGLPGANFQGHGGFGSF